MSDVTKIKNVLVLEGEFKDGDTRTQSFANDAEEITAEQINAIGDFVQENNLFIGDKAGADFLRYKSAKTRRVVTTQYDITPDA